MRRVVVHADDFGIAPGVDLGIERAFETGAITSASILLSGSSAPEALRWAAAHPEFDCGVHLDLTHGAPALPAARVPTLVDGHGRFHRLGALLTRLVLGRIRTDQVAAEWSAQIEAVARAGVIPSHLDSHQHVHLFPRLFRRVAVPLARERGLALRTMDGPAGFVGGRLDATGLLLAWTSRLAARGGEPGASRARGTGTALMGSPDVAVLRSLLRRMDDGSTYELVVHPGYADAALRASGDPYVEQREAELGFLDSNETRAALAEAGVELRSLRADQPRQGGGSEQWT